MAEGYECDRCGGLNAGTPHTLLTVGDGEERRGRQDRREEYHERMGDLLGDEAFDICPGCRSAFESWFENDA